jgi:hypothetical protein
MDKHEIIQELCDRLKELCRVEETTSQISNELKRHGDESGAVNTLRSAIEHLNHARKDINQALTHIEDSKL